ncbi:MAG TPA: ADOP family duplicated permease [Candidatus Acidoferrales bacterium]|nr:ADOP family duplicated permease [Candidatus Acidoferrales bacterium]
MKRRLREWLDETHGSAWELVRHFLLRFFDNDMITIPGEWQKVAVGIFASLVSVALALLSVYRDRYKHFDSAPFAEYHQGVRDDLISFIAITMAVTALLTILQWQSLFPSLRDCLALAGLPARPREIFLAKFAALMVVFSAFVTSMTGMPAILFTYLVTGRWQENPGIFIYVAASFVALAGGCAFVFFTLVAIQGILLHLFRPHTFGRISLAVQAVLFVATVGAVPLMGRQPATAYWWPPLWFVHLWESMITGPAPLARNALLAIAIPAAVSILAYLLSYHRYRRMLLEARVSPPSARRAGLGPRLLERWIADPREQAAFAFIWKTLFRSRSHRLFLLAYAGAALGWITKGLLDTPPVNLRDEGLYGFTVVVAPVAVSILITLGLRYLFTLPVMLRANWVFQAVESEDRPAWNAAIERFVICTGILPVFAAGLPAAVAVLGPVRGPAATGLGLAAAVIFFERYFRDWRKLPFTCSYLPGKQPVWLLITRFAVGSTFLVPIAQLLLWASADVTSFIALSTGLAALWWRWRLRRRRLWSAATTLWDEQPAPAVEAIDLQRAKDDDGPLSLGSVRPSVPEFGSSLIASRGLLPQSWREEIDEDRRSRALWETFWEDVRYGARLIRRNPLLSAVVVVTLTVGIGINASVFTVVDRVALKPLVHRDPESFLRLFPENQRTGHDRPVSYSEYIALRERNRSLRQLAAFRLFPALIGDEDTVGSPALAVSCNFFLVEGLDRPLLGRLIDANDCRAPGQLPVALISETVWRTRFQSDPKIIGRSARINNRTIPIVGVLSDRTSLWVQPVGVWVPYTAQPFFDVDRNFFQEDAFLWLFLAGRLAPGYSRSQAEAEFNGLERQLDALEPGRRTAVETTDGSWMQTFELSAGGRELFLVSFFFGAFYLVLFIACANVATLLLSRAATRRREIAVRLSLGAPRIRLVRMLVTESVLLAALAGAASVYLLYHVPRPLFRHIAPRSPEIPMPPDWSVFAYVAIIVLLTGLASGLAPALESVKVDLAASMKGAGGTLGGSVGGSRVRGWLVTAQVAMSLVLLVEAALFGQSENHNLHSDPGYMPRHVVVAPLRFPDNTPPAAAEARYNRIAERLRALPGVRSVAVSDDAPMIDHYTVQVRPPARPDAVQPVDVYSASAGFMNTLGVPLVRGRDFLPTDRFAIVVSESLARTFFRRQDPVGKVLDFHGVPVTIVGVARDVAPLRIGGSDNPPAWRTGITHPERVFLTVRFATPALASPASIRAAIREVDPNLVVISRNLQSWIDLVTDSMWNMVTLIVILGMVATALATSGIYGAVSFAVNQRMRDLGIRVALGATRATIVREVLVMGGKPVGRGLVIGAWISVAMAASLRENLKGSILRIDSTDPLVYGSAIVLLAVAAAIAMIGPAHRGSTSDPLDALRCE